MFDWDAFLVRMQAYPSHFHRFLPPCPEDELRAVEKELGTLPPTLKAMLSRFNGAKLFFSAGESISFFSISASLPPTPFEWSPDWCIDTFTPKWRLAGSIRQSDWAIAMTNYGGLIVLDGDDELLGIFRTVDSLKSGVAI